MLETNCTSEIIRIIRPPYFCDCGCFFLCIRAEISQNVTTLTMVTVIHSTSILSTLRDSLQIKWERVTVRSFNNYKLFSNILTLRFRPT